MKLSFAALLAAVSTVSAAATTNGYETYPPVPKTASINGFADRIYADLPECARPCVSISVSLTPCPYWDTGCLCVMAPWGASVAQCIAQKCRGHDVSVATSLAISQCSSAGVWLPYWILPPSASSALASAATA